MSRFDPLGALTPATWERANRELLAKLLGELTFEEVLAPEVATDAAAADDAAADDGTATTDGAAAAGGTAAHGRPWAQLAFPFPDGLALHARARLRSLGQWRLDPASLRATRDGAAAPLPDAAELVALGAPALGADPSTTAGLVGEIAATLLSDAAQLASGRPVSELLDADERTLEGELRGHPWIVASKGRVGFSAGDLAAYAPEARTPLRLRWLAADPALADARGLPNAAVVHEQLGDDGWALLRSRAAAAGRDPDGVVYLPVHPWQWTQRIVPLHAAELARGALTPLGEAPPRYLPTQSIRTLVDAEDPARRQLKVALSILNTSVYRGLPRARTLAAPALSAWLAGLVADDPFLVESGLVLLGEVASVSVPHAPFEAIDGVPYQHTELLGAIWREPVAPRLRDGERAIPLAALLHRDPRGGAFAAALIARSGLSAGAWVERLHAVTLPPLAHVLYRYGAAFSPHGQNCLLVLAGDVPSRLIVRDFVDDATIAAAPLPELASLPADVRAALGDGVEPAILPQWLLCGLLVCVHRYLAELLEDELGYRERDFWAAARAALDRYQERFAPQMEERFALFELDAPTFVKLCLNRVRLLERGYADDAERPIASASGWIENPLAAPPAPDPAGAHGGAAGAGASA